MSLQDVVARVFGTGSLVVVGRLSYHGLAWGLGLAFRAMPRIRAAYLAGSMANDDLAPGLSDIDFVLVISDLSWEEEYRLVLRIENIVRYTMPPWGRPKIGRHILIYAKREWTVVADLFLGKRCGSPRTVFDKDGIQPVHAMSDSLKGLHHIYKALWRLEGLQIALWNGPDTQLERRLCARMAERMKISIRNAVGEYTRSAGQARRDSDPLSEPDTRPDPACGPDALPGLLRELDEAVSFYAPPEPDSPRLESAGRSEPVGALDQEAPESAALVSSAAEGVLVWVARVGSRDFVILDPNASGAAAGIFRRFLEAGTRQPFIITRTLFERLYLNAPSPPWTLYRLPEGLPRTVAGAYTRDRALIDAYGAFPRVRGVVGNPEPRQYAATRSTIADLEAYFAVSTTGDRAQNHDVLQAPRSGVEAENPHDPRRAYRDLHDRATRLVHSLSEYLNPGTMSP